MINLHTFYDRSKLKKDIDYITRPGVEYVDVRNLSKYRGDYAEQFNETFRLYNKRTEKDKPQFYGYIVHYDPRDNPSPKDVQEACVRLMEITFPDFECVIATHTDTDKLHTHILMNSVNLVTGYKLKFTSRDLAKMLEDHVRIGESYGYTHTQITERDPDYRTSAELRILARGGWSWKEDIRKFVKGAIEDVRVTTPEDFMAFLSDYNMEVLDTGKEFLYFHPKVAQGVRSKKLGPYYTRKSVMAAIERNREAAERRETERREAERLEAERQEAEKTPSITQLDEYSKIEVWFKFGKRIAEAGLLYKDFKEFVEEVEKYEKEGTLASYVRGWVEDALKDPLTAKDYGELTWEKFYREKRYALFCQECKRDNVVPVSRDIFYHDNGWKDPENIAEQETVGREGNKAVSIDMLDDYTKVEVWFRYAENVVKAGRSWRDFNDLVKHIKNAEREDCLKPSLFGYIEVGFRNPVSKKDYGELSSVEFYHEKRYALSIEECERDNRIPLSRDDFYRDNGWGVPESLARLEAERPEAGNHEVENHEVENHEVENHEVENHEVENHEVENHEVENHEVASQEVASQEVASQEVASQEVASQEVASQEVASQEVASQEVENQEAASQEAASQEAARQEVEKKEIVQTSSITQLDEHNKIDVWFRYAEREIKNNNLYYDFNDFVEKVEEIEKEGNRVVFVSDCIDDALKNPITEKDRGNLNANEFYCEMAYELYCEECERDNEIPLSRDDFYRDNDWTVSESLAKEEVAKEEVAKEEVASEEGGDREDNSWEDEGSEDVNREDEKQVSISQLDDYTKVSAWFEYAKDQVIWGHSYFDFQLFEICAEFNGKSSSFAIGQKYVEEAFKHPTTEKEYGDLSSTEFYHEKCYELYLVECEKGKKSPLSREGYYREKVWTVPKCLAEQSKAAADGGSAKPADGNSQNKRSVEPATISIDRLDERTRIDVWFRYAEEKVKEGESYLDYTPFVRKIREEEKAGHVEDSVRGYIEDGFRNPMTKEKCGELSTVELYHEMQYILFVDQSVSLGTTPYRRGEFYSKMRYNLPESLKNRPDGVAVATIGKMPSSDDVPARGISGREEPKKDGTSENPPSHKQNAVSIDMLDEYTLVYVWARYSEDLLKAGELTYEFDDFADWAKEAESEGSLPPNLRGYIKEGIKFPATEKDYGKLSPEEFRQKKEYELECLYRRLHYLCSVSMEEYYRQNNWTIPDSLKKRRDNYMGK